MLTELDLNTSELAEDALLSFSQNDRQISAEFIAHHGIKGQRWGVRRYQNSDGSLTEEGKLRYGDSRSSKLHKGKTKGQVRFVRDAIASLDRTPLSKDKKAFDETIEQLGRAAEESGVMDPNNSLSPYHLSSSSDQTRILDTIYNNMPSVKKERIKQADSIIKNADGYRQEKIDHLDEVIDEFHPDIHKGLGTTKGVETRNFIIDAIKGYNESDPDMVTYQHMDLVPEFYYDGLIDKKTFDKVYDAEAAEDAVDWLGYGLDAEFIKKYNEVYKKIQHSDQDGDYLAHHGIKGQKWGVRRYQNGDGSLTPEGRQRYGVSSKLRKAASVVGRAAGKAVRKATGRETDAELDAELAKQQDRLTRRHKKEAIKDLKIRSSGRKKKLHEMTDSELDDYINRKIKEKKIRDLEKEEREANRGPVSKFLTDVAKASADSAVRGIGRGVEESISKSIAAKSAQKTQHKLELKERKWNVKNQDKNLTEDQKLARKAARAESKRNAARDNVEARAYKNDQAAQDLMSRARNNWKVPKDGGDNPSKEAADRASNKAKIAKSTLEYMAYSGNKKVADEAKRRLSTTAQAMKGNNGNNGKGNPNNNQNNGQNDKPKKKKKNKNKNNDVQHSDFLASISQEHIGMAIGVEKTDLVDALSSETIESTR